MQVFFRRAGEGVLIGDDIKVSVVSIEAPYVTLGISSPNTQPDYRELTIRCEEREWTTMPEEILSVR